MVAPAPAPPAASRHQMVSPVDLDGPATIGGRPLLWAAGVVAVAALVLLLANAATIDGWAAELPPSEAVARLNLLTARWRGITDAAGLGAPRAALHRGWQEAQAARFPGQPPAQ